MPVAEGLPPPLGGGPLRAAWSRPKQIDLVPGKGAVPLAFPANRLSTVVRQGFFCIPATDTDIISAQHFWTGGLETAGPGRYDAVVIARAAGFRVMVMGRIRHAAIVPFPDNRSEPAKTERPK